MPRCKMYEIQMLGILDHNLTTVTVPLLDMEDAARLRKESKPNQRRAAREEFDNSIFRSTRTDERAELAPIRSRDSGSTGALSMSANVASFQSARLLAAKSLEKKTSTTSLLVGSPGTAMSGSPWVRGLGISNGADSMSTPSKQISPAADRSALDVSPITIRKAERSGSNASKSPFNRLRDLPPFDASDLQRSAVRGASPAPSSLSMSRSARPRSPSRVSDLTNDPSSGQSTPKMTPHKKLNTKSSRSSFASRIGANWLLSALTTRAQPSFPTAATETITRQDVSSVTGNRSPSPVSAKSPVILPRPVPGAPIVTPSTPSPSKLTHQAGKVTTTQPVPIASRRQVPMNAEEPVKSFKNSLKNSFKASKSPMDSWHKAAAANFNRGKSHVTVNPCNPKVNDDSMFGEGRRWQHLRPKPAKESQHLVKWTALTAPACLPLTTDFMPTTQEIQDFYELNSYDIACYPDQVSFLVRPDAANTNLPLAVMREMASQRLSREFS